MKTKLLTLLILAGLMTSCASEGLKAPCNQHASFCGSKTKINHW
jgi:hypothetical protein